MAPRNQRGAFFMPLPKSFGWTPSLPDFRDFPFSSPRVVLENMPPAVDLSQPELGEPWGTPWDQGQLGSCGPQTSAADIVFSMLRQQGYATGPMPSRLFVYWCARFLMGTVNSDSGVDNRSMLKALSRFGWCDEELWPYSDDQVRFRQRPPDICFEQAATRKIDQFLAVPQELEVMKSCLAGGDPFIFGWSVFKPSVDEADATGIVPMPDRRRDSHVGGHDVLVVGYNDGPEVRLGIPPRHFKHRGSWSKRWGQKGYGFHPYEYGASAGLSGDFWTVRHSSYRPPNPPTPVPVPPAPPTPVPTPSPDTGGSMSKWEILMWVVAFLKSERGQMLVNMVQELLEWLWSQKPKTAEECEACVSSFATTKGLAI